MEEPIFIVGVARSGTTLVRVILNCHSRIAVASETHFFRVFWAGRRQFGSFKNDEKFLKFWNVLSHSKHFSDLGLSDVRNIQSKVFNGERSYKAVFETLMTEYASAHNKARWGEKTPGHLPYIKQILKYYPEAKIIHIVRDPRDVALSLKLVPWGHSDVFSSAALWNEYMKKSRKFLKKETCYIEIRYEDLVAMPREIIAKVCAFLGEEPEERMLEFHKYSGRYIEKDEPWKQQCREPLTTLCVGKWKNGLSEYEIEKIVVKCRRAMVEKGYLRPKKTILSGEVLTMVAKRLYFRWLWYYRILCDIALKVKGRLR